MNPLISVIMPVYNNERYFPNAVESVLSQSFRDFELIVVDDGSTDNTPQIADNFTKKDNRVKVIHQENQWIYASLNNGIEKARGEYIYFLNSDDILLKDALRKMSDIAKKYRPDVIWTRIILQNCDEEQKAINKGIIYEVDDRVSLDYFYNDIQIFRNVYIYIQRSGLADDQANLYRKSFFTNHKFRVDISAADTMFNIQIAPDINSSYVLSEPTYLHFTYNTGNMNTYNKYFAHHHSMHNELFSESIDMFIKLGVDICDSEVCKIISNRRLINSRQEICSILSESCKMSINQKLEKLINEVIDDIVTQCSLTTNRIEEMESRVLSACNELFAKEPIDEKSEFYFIYEMLHALLKYEKTDEDMQKIKAGVFHEKNPHNIGKSFYEKLIKGNN